MYPEVSLQSVLAPTPWWEEDKNIDYKRGRLVKAFIPHVDQYPFTLIPVGRTEATEHTKAYVEIKPLNIRSIMRYPRLPVAALPQYEGEVRAIYRAKKRPALIISGGGRQIPKSLTKGKAKWQTSRTVIVAPYYGGDKGGKRAGFNPKFLERVRRCEYPQYVWDRLPIENSAVDSVMRLDHMQPVGRSQDAIEHTDYCLSEDALELLDEWLEWLIKGSLDPETTFSGVREDLLNL